MRKILLLLNVFLISFCLAQKKITLKKFNEHQLSNENFSYLDSVETIGVKQAFTKIRLEGAKSCGINPHKKYSEIYLEDGFHDEIGYYDGIIKVENSICEITTNPYKLAIDSLSYKKVKINNFLPIYIKRISKDEFKTKYKNEYFRNELVNQNKTIDFNKCLSIDKFTPKSAVYVKTNKFTDGNYTFYNDIKIKYSELKDGIYGIPYLKDEKKQEFVNCINNLKILEVSYSDERQK